MVDCHIPHFIGQITNIGYNKVSFKSDRRIPVDEKGKPIKYMVMFRPQRTGFNLRYYILNALVSKMNLLEKFLFPNKLEYMPLPNQP